MSEHTPWVRLPVWAQEVLLAGFITVMQVQGTITRNAGEPTPVIRHLDDLGGLGYLLLAVSGLSLLGRRRWPAAVLAVTALCSVGYYALDFPDGPGWLALFIALYTFVSLGDGHRTLWLAGASIVVLTVVWLVAAADIEPAAAIGWVYFRIGAAVMSAALGESVRSRRVIAERALERAELAERTRDEQARAQVDEERLRIAREVHDTVAHTIAVINVQSAITAHVLDRQPERARETFEIIERVSSQALQEMRTVLGVLRDPDDGKVPHPGIEQIDDLAAVAQRAGLDLRLSAEPPAEPLPTAVASTIYRIVQESITNVIRHVGPTGVTVELDYGADEVGVRVNNEAPRGVAPSSTEAGWPGRGIVGMRERCRLLGGDLVASPTSAGGFEVSARLPYAPTETAVL